MKSCPGSAAGSPAAVGGQRQSPAKNCGWNWKRWRVTRQAGEVDVLEPELVRAAVDQGEREGLLGGDDVGAAVAGAGRPPRPRRRRSRPGSRMAARSAAAASVAARTAPGAGRAAGRPAPAGRGRPAPGRGPPAGRAGPRGRSGRAGGRWGRQLQGGQVHAGVLTVGRGVAGLRWAGAGAGVTIGRRGGGASRPPGSMGDDPGSFGPEFGSGRIGAGGTGSSGAVVPGSNGDGVLAGGGAGRRGSAPGPLPGAGAAGGGAGRSRCQASSMSSVAGPLDRDDQAVVGPLRHRREGLGGAVVRGRGGAVRVVGVGEPRQGRRLDREDVEAPPRVAALLEDRLGDVLVGPVAEESRPQPAPGTRARARAAARQRLRRAGAVLGSRVVSRIARDLRTGLGRRRRGLPGPRAATADGIGRAGRAG